MALFILILGLVAIFRTPTDIFPEINTPVVTAVWSYSGMSAKDIERRIVTLAERSYVANVNDVEHVESQSLYGVGVIKVFLHPGTDINTGITQVNAGSQICMKNMPLGIKPPEIIKYTPTSIPVLQVAISSKVLPIQAVTDLAQNNIKVMISKVEGTQAPLPMGGKVRQVMVDLDMQKMEARGLTPMDVVNSIASENVILPSGDAKIGKIDYYVTLNNSTKTIDEMNMFPIKSPKGETIYLRDIAYIHDGNAVQTNIVRANGTASSLMVIYKAGKTSTIKLVNEAKAMLPVIAKTIPESVKMQVLFDQSTFVKNAINDVVFSGTLAAALTALMVLLFLGSIRSTFIIALSIPLAILFSIICTSSQGETLNMMTLSGLGLAIGMLVDNSTVVIENILRNKEVYQEKLSLKEVIYKSAVEVASPTLVSTLSICTVFAPIFLMEGATKYLFTPLAKSVIFAMIGSYILSNTLVPVLVDKLLGEKEVLKQGSILYKTNKFINDNFAKVRETYKSFLIKDVIPKPKKVGIAYGIIILVSFMLLPLIGQNFFPEVDSGQIRLHVYAPHGTRIEDTAREFTQIEDTIKEVIPKKDLSTMLDNIGLPASMLNLAFMDNSQIGTGDGEILISLNKHHDPTSKYVKDLRVTLNKKYPNTQFFFQSADIVSKILNFGLASPIDIQIQGRKLKQNYAITQKMLSEVKKVRGVADAHIHQIVDTPEIKLNADKGKAGEMKLSQEDIAKNVLVALSSSNQAMPAYWVDPQNGVNYNLALQVPTYNINSVKDVTDIPIAFDKS